MPRRPSLRIDPAHAESLGVNLAGLPGAPDLSGPTLALDPSSTACGWAIFEGPDRLRDCGVLRPPGKWPALARIDRLVAEVEALAIDRGVERAVLEYSAGKVSGGAKRGYSGLAVLGQAQGEVRRALIALLGARDVHTVTEAWTGKQRKEDRATLVRSAFPVYAAFFASGKDRGLDAADAVGLGSHWLRHAPLEALQSRS